MGGTYKAEQEMKGRGALYEKTLMPFASNVVRAAIGLANVASKPYLLLRWLGA